MAERLSVAEQVAIDRWVHAMVHLRARKGKGLLPEFAWIAECWMPESPPGWAVELATSGEPGTLWCPVLSPHLGQVAVVQES